jgi:exodeoxyribonuclease-3
MKVVTLNVNGLVNASQRGFFEWLEKLDADVVCVQEVRAKEYQLPESFLEIPGYHAFLFDAEEDGYSGTAI